MIDLQKIAEALGKHVKTGNGYDACCPVHGEKNPSLSISVGDNGKLITHCHAQGCSHADIMTELERMGVVESNGRRKPGQKTVYEIRDVSGELVARHIRLDRPDERKRVWWEPRLKTIGRGVKDLPLYRIEKVADAETVVITEGEKACDALWAIGVPAVGTVTGASATPSVAVLRDLKGKKIELWPDNDEQGHKHMERIARKLTSQGIENTTVDWTDSPPKGDADDFVQAGGKKEGFLEIPRAGKKADRKWEYALRTTSSGGYASCDSNVISTLKAHNIFTGNLGYDERAHEPVFMAPVDGITTTGDIYPRPIKEHEIGKLVQWFQLEMAIDAGYNKLAMLIRPTCMDPGCARQFDPFRDYLMSLKWDGKKRVVTCLAEHAGAQDTEYVQSVTKCMMISAVARTFSPGCKVDTMLILVGEQGIGKSTLFRSLVPNDRFFTDHLPNITDKDARAQLHGLVFLEIAELEAFTNAETSAIKGFITAQIDKFRPPYGRTTVEFPRTCVMVGTTNSDSFLKDVTGARRFLPVKVDGKIDIPWFVENRDALWAESVHMYRDGEPWWLNGKETSEQKAVAEQYREEIVWEEVIEAHLRESFSRCDTGINQNRFNPYGTRIWTTVGDIFTALGIEVSKRGRKEQIAVGKVLRLLGWSRERRMIGGQRGYWYRAPDSFIEKSAGLEGGENVVQMPAQSEIEYETTTGGLSGPIDY